MRALLYGLIGLIVLVVAGVFVAPSLIDWTPYKRDIAEEVKAATGRELTIAGALNLSLLPSAHLVADDVRLANLTGAAVPDLMRVKSLRIDVRFWPLLRGRVEVETIRLVAPVVELERLANDRVNWDLAPAPAVGAPAPQRETGMEFLVERLVVVDGAVTYRDTAAREVERAEKVNAEVTASSFSGPFRVSGKLTAYGMPLAIEGSSGALETEKPTPLSLRVASNGVTIDFGGTLADIGTKPRLDGKLKVASDNFATAFQGAAVPKALAGKLALSAGLKASHDGATLDNLDLDLGDLRARGQVKAAFGAHPHVDATLAANRLVLAPWLETQGRPSAGGFALPAKLAGSVDLAVQLVEGPGGPYRDAKIVAKLADGELHLERAGARLPGDATVSLRGVVAARGGKPAFDGTLAANANNLRGVLEALKLDVAKIPGDRLLRSSLAAKMKAEGDKLEILDIDAQLDSSRLRGGVVVALGDRPGFGATVDIDQINLDGYLPNGASAGSPRPPARGKKAENPFDDFDANIRARIGALNYGGLALQNVAFDGTLQAGALSVREVSAREASGATVKLEGKMTRLEAAPLFDLDRIEAVLHDIPVTGAGKVDFAGARPALVATLNVGDVVLNIKEGSSGERWSREKFDLSALDSFDAELTVDGNSVAYRNWHVEAPRVVAKLKDRLLDVTELSGRMFDGVFKLNLQLDSTDIPKIAAKLHVDKANIAAALFATGRTGLDLTAGNLNLDADVVARGDSAFALISSLAGTAKIAMRDGVVKGFDLPAVSRRLKEVNDPFDLLSLGDLFSGGQSKVDSLDGTFKIDEGVIRTNDLSLVAPAGAGFATGGADIAHWTIYTKAEFHLTELLDAPPVVLVFTEALDAPVPTIFADELRDWVIRRGLGQEEKRKPAPTPATAVNPAPPPKPAPPQGASPAAPNGKDITRGLLEGLAP